MLGNLQNLESITVSENNPYLIVENGVLYSKDFTTLIHYPAKKVGKDYEIPNTVTIIGGQAFRFCRNLKSVTMPDTVTEIRVQAFSGCSNLTSIRIPNKVTRIGSYVFDGCTNLTDIYVDKDESTTLFANASVPSGCNIHWNSTGPAQVN